jgi:DNA polymerase-3 subunit delta'
MQFTDIRFHKQLFSAWNKMIDSGRFPHTVLLTGQDGYGVLYAAVELATRLLCDTDECVQKIRGFNHPDLHFVFPTVTSPKGASETSASFYTNEFKEFVTQNLFGSYDDWMAFLESGNKQGMIRVKDAEELMHKAYQYPAMGDKKVFVVWHAEKMNSGTANKLLKLLEEPPENTFFILTTDHPLNILATIRSRCQEFQIPPVPRSEMAEELKKREISGTEIETILQLAEGDFKKALQVLGSEDPFVKHKDYFVRWVRIAYQAKKKRQAINDLIDWSEQLSGESRHFQMDFLRFALEMFRRSYVSHFNPGLPLFEFPGQQFKMEKFAPFIHSGNIDAFYKGLNDAIYHLVRNANPKITFLNLSIEMTRLLHRKENAV